MAKNKTVETESSVPAYLDRIVDEIKRNDCTEIIRMVTKLTKLKPKMWGTGIVGFGSYHYKYESGREGDAPLVGFSPRKDAIVLYLSANFDKREELLEQFGKHKTGKGCIYIKKLEDVKESVLKKMIAASMKHKNKLYP